MGWSFGWVEKEMARLSVGRENQQEGFGFLGVFGF